jgi:hypothetical protein
VVYSRHRIFVRYQTPQHVIYAFMRRELPHYEAESGLMIKLAVELYAALCAFSIVAFLALALTSKRTGVFDDLESMKESDRGSAFDSQIDKLTEVAGGHARSTHVSN